MKAKTKAGLIRDVLLMLWTIAGAFVGLTVAIFFGHDFNHLVIFLLCFMWAAFFIARRCKSGLLYEFVVLVAFAALLGEVMLMA